MKKNENKAGEKKMKPELSKKSLMFKRTISPVRQIMSYANPTYFKQLGLNPEEIISFAGGWVNHESPKDLQASYQRIIQNNEALHESGGYSPTLGMPSCKQALINYESHLYDINGLEEKNIAIGASSTQLTFDLMKVLLNPGDKILLLDPSYCNFPTQITMALDVEIIRFPIVDQTTWKIVADEKIDSFSNFIKEQKPKVILLISPDNPTSHVPSQRFVEAGLAAAEEVGSFLVVDFAYKDIVFNESLPNYYSWTPTDNFLSIHSNSKWSRSLGRRLGWIEASGEIVETMESVQGSSILCPDTLHQMALVDYLNTAITNNTLKPYIKKTAEQYRKAAKCTVQAIREHLKLPCFVPQGGLYTCIKVGKDGAQFVEDVLKNTGVLFVPGWGFGRSQQDAVRISFGPLVNNLHLIDKGMQKVGEYLKKLENDTQAITVENFTDRLGI